MQVCAAGLSTAASTRIDTIISSSGGSVGATALEELRGAIFDDPQLYGKDRVAIYDRYIDCILANGITVKKEDAGAAIQRVQYTNDYSSAGMFSSYDWVSSFSRGYKNIGDQPVECRLRVRGELERRSSGRPYLTGEAADFTFALEPGEVNHVEGEVGIEGFNDSRYQVTTSDRLECWYR